ncbi:MAG: hypothetical protein IAE99_00075, partial [Rhodothermales bacterium]|nr:hypothetical protein [Rhodothermales bacterium]
SWDKTVRVWDVDTGESMVLEGHTAEVNSVSWSPTGRLTSASSDNTVRVWDVDTGESMVLLEGWALDSTFWERYAALSSPASRSVLLWERLGHDLRAWRREASAWLSPVPDYLSSSPVAPVLAGRLGNEVVLYRWEEE